MKGIGLLSLVAAASLGCGEPSQQPFIPSYSSVFTVPEFGERDSRVCIDLDLFLDCTERDYQDYSFLRREQELRARGYELWKSFFADDTYESQFAPPAGDGFHYILNNRGSYSISGMIGTLCHYVVYRRKKC